MPGPQRPAPIPDRPDGKYGDKAPLVPEMDVTTTSLDNLDVRISQASFNKTCDVDAEKKMLKALDDCIAESASMENVSYDIRPGLGERFRPMAVSEVIHDVLYEELSEKVYALEEVKGWTLTISDTIRNRVKDLFARYKIMVQVVIGEHRGAGCVIGCRCCWDSDTDAFATNQFINDTIFCCVMVFGVFYY